MRQIFMEKVWWRDSMQIRKKLLPIMILVMFFLHGCGGKQISVKQALHEAGTDVKEIYHIEEFGDKAAAFYQKDQSEVLTVGLFYKIQNGWHFIIEDELGKQEDFNRGLTRTIFMQSKTEIPEFSFLYGIINNSKIEKVNLHMTSGDENDRYAIVRKIKGRRVWYDLLEGSRTFNICQGISKDGEIIFDSSKKQL
ncbi:MAG: hypothetical protein ACOWWO_00345 [Peptococcaceae bacterium]